MIDSSARSHLLVFLHRDRLEHLHVDLLVRLAVEGLLDDDLIALGEFGTHGAAFLELTDEEGQRRHDGRTATQAARPADAYSLSAPSTSAPGHRPLPLVSMIARRGRRNQNTGGKSVRCGGGGCGEAAVGGRPLLGRRGRRPTSS